MHRIIEYRSSQTGNWGKALTLPTDVPRDCVFVRDFGAKRRLLDAGSWTVVWISSLDRNARIRFWRNVEISLKVGTSSVLVVDFSQLFLVTVSKARVRYKIDKIDPNVGPVQGFLKRRSEMIPCLIDFVNSSGLLSLWPPKWKVHLNGEVWEAWNFVTLHQYIPCNRVIRFGDGQFFQSRSCYSLDRCLQKVRSFWTPVNDASLPTRQRNKSLNVSKWLPIFVVSRELRQVDLGKMETRVSSWFRGGGEVPSLSLVIKVSQLSRVASLGDFVDVAGEVFHCWQVPASAKASMAHLKWCPHLTRI